MIENPRSALRVRRNVCSNFMVLLLLLLLRLAHEKLVCSSFEMAHHPGDDERDAHRPEAHEAIFERFSLISKHFSAQPDLWMRHAENIGIRFGCTAA